MSGAERRGRGGVVCVVRCFGPVNYGGSAAVQNGKDERDDSQTVKLNMLS